VKVFSAALDGGVVRSLVERSVERTSLAGSASHKKDFGGLSSPLAQCGTRSGAPLGRVEDDRTTTLQAHRASAYREERRCASRPPTSFSLAPSREPAPALAGKWITVLRNSMDTPKITFCPPAPPRHELHFDKAQFAARRQYPVEAHYVGLNNGENGVASTGLSFGDYGNMQTQNHRVVGRQRRLETPEYMLDEARRRRVMIRFLELRAGLNVKQHGTEHERLARAEFKLKQSIPRFEALLEECALDYMTSPDAAQRKRSQQRIAEYASIIRVNRDPAIIPAMARVYYFEQLDSVGVAERFGLNSDQIRQMLYRLTQLDAAIQAGHGEGREKQPQPKRAPLVATTLREVRKEIAARAQHSRWHVKRGIISTDCALCAQGAQNLLVGARQDAGNQSQHVSAS
jgi:hypothetical protein